MSESAPSAQGHERLGRQVGLGLFSLVVGILAVNFSTQIIVQAFGLKHAPPRTACTEGLTHLIEGVEQARQSAASLDGEAPALEAFRGALGPAWLDPYAVREACRDQPRWLRAFREVERLRYAEEHAVRYESRGVAVDRRSILALERELQQTAPAAPAH